MKTLRIIAIVLLSVFVAVFILNTPLAIVGFFSLISGEGKLIQTTDIADYGTINGNYDNDTPATFIFSFFPETISNDFSNVKYQYIAQKGDAYACQVWLEFDIEDEEKFNDFIHTYTDSEQTAIFQYDPDYMDYTTSNDFTLTRPENDEPGDIHIEYARIGKIMYSESSQHIICYALCIYDGGYSSTKTFGDFFERFNIDPVEYGVALANIT